MRPGDRTTRWIALLAGAAVAVSTSPLAPAVAAIVPGPITQLTDSGTVESIPPPVVRAAADGYAIAVWATDAADAHRYLEGRLRAPDGTWSDTVRLTGLIDGQGLHPDRTYFSVGMNRAGDIAVGWIQVGQIWVAQLPRGGSSWTAHRASGLVHDVYDFSGPAVTVLPDGRAVAAWRADSDPDSSTGFTRLLTATGAPGAWGTEQIQSGREYVPVVGDSGAPDVTGFSLASDGSGRAYLRWTEKTDVPATPGMPTMRERINGNSQAPGTSSWSEPTPLTDVADPYAKPVYASIVGDRMGAGIVEARLFEPTDAEVAAGVTGRRLQLRSGGAVREFRNTDLNRNLAGLSLVNGEAVARLYWTDSGSQTGFTTVRNGAWSDLESPLGADDNLYSGTQVSWGQHADGAVSMVYLSGNIRRVRAVHRAPGATTWDAERTISSFDAPSSAQVPVLSVADHRLAVVTWHMGGNAFAATFTSDTEAVTPPPPPPPPPATFTQVTPPRITGKMRVGKRLRARPGSWTPTPTATKYQWLANGKRIRKATQARLLLTRRLKGKKIAVRITISAPGITKKMTVKAKGRVRPSP